MTCWRNRQVKELKDGIWFELVRVMLRKKCTGRWTVGDATYARSWLIHGASSKKASVSCGGCSETDTHCLVSRPRRA